MFGGGFSFFPESARPFSLADVAAIGGQAPALVQARAVGWGHRDGDR